MQLEKKSINKDDYNDKIISRAIVLYYLLFTLHCTVSLVFQTMNTDILTICKLLIASLMLFVFAKALPIVIKRKMFQWIIIYMVALIVLLVNLLIFPQNFKFLISDSKYLYFICIPSFLYYISIKNKDVLLNTFLKLIYWNYFLCILMTAYLLLGRINEFMNYQSYSYSMALAVILLLYKLYNKFNFLDLSFVIIGIVAIVVFGSRGSLLVVLTFVVMLFLNMHLKTKQKIANWTILVLVICILIITLIFLQPIVQGLYDKGLDYGLDSRIFFLLSGQYNDFSTGRLEIYSETWHKFTQRPILGYGVSGDRLFLDGTYPHNLFLELLVQYGLFVGLFLNIGITIGVVKSITANISDSKKMLAYIFFSYGFVPILISGTYLTSPQLWIYLAICWESIFVKKIVNNTQTI